MTCDFCGNELPSRVLLCPCGRFSYGKRIATLAREADELEVGGDKPAARERWRAALDLIPSETGQAREIRARLERLGPDEREAAPGGPRGSGAKGIAGALAGIGLVAAKFKSVALLAAKGSKLLFSALTMVVAVWVYSKVFGHRFAVGLVLLTWIHEMGHVIANRWYGNAVSAPVFIPFLGAFIRLKVEPRNAFEDAVCGLAGPFLGSVGALAALGLSAAVGGETGELLFALGHIAIWINLFNLIPIYPMDGGRAASVLDSRLWLVGTIAVVAGGFAIGEPYLGILAIFPMGRVFQGEHARRQGGPLARYHTISMGKRVAGALAYVLLAALLFGVEARTRGDADALLRKHAHPDDLKSIERTDDDEGR